MPSMDNFLKHAHVIRLIISNAEHSEILYLWLRAVALDYACLPRPTIKCFSVFAGFPLVDATSNSVITVNKVLTD